MSKTGHTLLEVATHLVELTQDLVGRGPTVFEVALKSVETTPWRVGRVYPNLGQNLVKDAGRPGFFSSLHRRRAPHRGRVKAGQDAA